MDSSKNEKDPLKKSLVGFTLSPPEIRFKRPWLSLLGSAGAIPDLQSFVRAFSGCFRPLTSGSKTFLGTVRLQYLFRDPLLFLISPRSLLVAP